jgi:hypothetical protein
VGSNNFRIVGSVYNGDLNILDLKVKCMRCGKERAADSDTAMKMVMRIVCESEYERARPA